MKQKLNMLLTPVKGNPVYDAAYNAYYNSISSSFNDANDAFAVDPNNSTLISEVNSIKEQTKTQMQIDADNFAIEFCKGLQNGKFMESIADEINQHIKSMMLSISVPALPPTLISPMGPVTGSLIISPTSGAQITIS